MKKNIMGSFIAPLLIIIFAIVLYQNPENFISVAVSIFGYGAIFLGVLNLVMYFRLKEEERYLSRQMTNGILFISFGIAAFFENALFTEMITVILGAYVLLQNASRISLSFTLQKLTKSIWLYIFVMSLMNLIIGLFIIVNPFPASQLNFYLASLLVIAEAFLIIENFIILIGVRCNDKEN